MSDINAVTRFKKYVALVSSDMGKTYQRSVGEVKSVRTITQCYYTARFEAITNTRVRRVCNEAN